MTPPTNASLAVEPVAEAGASAPDLRLVAATIRAFLLRYASNPVLLIRAPITPVLFMIGFYLAYQISGQQTVDGFDSTGFLVIGMIGTGAWSSTVWGAGSAIDSEVYTGTISAVVAAPGRLSAVITGHGIASMLFGLPALLASAITGLLLGADFDIADPLAALVCLVAVYACCLCIGLAFGGLFVLSRQSNALSNFLQTPIYLLAGFFVPVSALPQWLQSVSALLPISHAVTALRATTLGGADLGDVGGDLAAAGLTSLMFFLAGLWSLRYLDIVVRRRATLDLL